MKATELIEMLQQLVDEHGDCDVRLATQPNWPFENEVGAVTAAYFGAPDEADEEDEADVMDDTHDACVFYIGEGDQVGYLPGVASVELGWRNR